VQATKQQARDETRLAKIRTLGGFLDEKYAPWVLETRQSGAATLARLRHNFAALLDIPLHDIAPWTLTGEL
jgi:hypothetical protein